MMTRTLPALFPSPAVNTRRYVCVRQVPSGRRQLQNDTLATDLPVAVLSEKTHDVLIKLTVAFPVWYCTYWLRGRAATFLDKIAVYASHLLFWNPSVPGNQASLS